MTNMLLDSLQRASIHGAIAIAVVLISCLVFRKYINEATECWLWRLVFLQMLALMFLTSPFQIPVFESDVLQADAPGESAMVARGSLSEINSDDSELTRDLYDEMVNAEAIELARRSNLSNKDENVSALGPVSNFQASTRGRLTEADSTSSLALILGTIWAIGIVFCLFILFASWRKRIVIWNSLTFLDEHQSAKLIACCNPGLQPLVPGLATTTMTSSPFLIGVARPVIVLPESLLAELTPVQTKEILAHEIAHLQRRDLCWDWLVTAGQTVFFFHPLVWIASSRYRLVKEIACDQRAVAGSKTSMDSYAETLLMISAAANPALPAPAAASMFRSRQHLKRRFHAMNVYTPNHRFTNVTCLLLICIAGLGIVPWQLTAKAVGSNPASEIESSEIEPGDFPLVDRMGPIAKTKESDASNSGASTLLPAIASDVAPDEIDSKINELNLAFEDNPSDTIKKMRMFALEIARKHGTTSVEYGRVLGAAGRLYANFGDHETAVNLLTMSIDPRLASDDYQELQLDFKHELVDSMLLTGKTPKAVELATEALQKRKELFGEDKPAYAKGLTGMARVKMRQVKFPEAIELCKQARTIYQDSATEFPAADQATLVLSECLNTFYSAAKKSNGDSSVKDLMKQLDLSSTENAIDWESLSESSKKGLLNQVIHFQRLADPASRMVLFEKLAERLKDEPGLSRQHVSALIHQSNAADKLKLYPERLSILQSAIKATELGDPAICDLYMAMTRAYGSLNRPEDIRATFEKAVSYAQKYDLKRNHAQLIQSYARWLVYSGQNELAEPKYQQAVEAATEFGGVLLGETQVGFGLFLHDQKKFAEAAEMFEASLENLPGNSQLAMKAQMHLPFAKNGSPVPTAAGSGVTLGEPIKMNMKEFQAFQEKLAAEQKAKNEANGVEEEPEFVLYIKIPKFLSPTERGKFADPVDSALKESSLGQVYGGGTMISDQPYSGIDVAVKDLDKGIALIIEKLKESKVPEGTEILYTVDSKKESVDVWKK